MRQYTDEEIEALISCPKRVADPPRRELKPDRGFLRNDLTLESVDGTRIFHVFIRINERFPENFSIGLGYDPCDEPGTMVLLRFNGPHGEHILWPHHVRHHIHEARARVISLGLKPEMQARMTTEWASYRHALAAFLRRINLVDAPQYFAEVLQRSFSFEGENQK